MIVGFFFIMLMALWSITPMLEFIFALQLPNWLKGVLSIIAFCSWLCGLAFLSKAEKAVFNNKKICNSNKADE